MSCSYASLLSPMPALASEKGHAYHFLTERHVQAMWFEQKYFKNLQTRSGEPIEVISAGIWNADAGPDFRKCHLKIGPKELLGDVEIHLSDDFWYQHQHDTDPRYNQVVLHVSFWHPRSIHPISLQNGKHIHQAHLEHFLTVPEARIAQLINLDLYPYKKFLGSGRCAQALFRKLPEEEIAAFFQKAADWRLKQKRDYLKSRFPEDSQCLGGGIAMALGYKNNAEAFLELYSKLQSRQHLDNMDATLACLMASCGYFDRPYKEKWAGSAYYAQLNVLALSLDRMALVKLNHSQLRPLNQPIRRLAFLAKMHLDASMQTLCEQMKSRWRQSWRNCHQANKWTSLMRDLQDLLPSYQDPYWNHHYSFEEGRREEFIPLIGQDTKREILVNSFLPLMQDEVLGRADPLEIKAFGHFFEAFPASRTGKSKYLTHRYFGNTEKGSILNRAYTEQGAYQLHYDFCVHYEAGCEGCPFVDRYLKTRER